MAVDEIYRLALFMITRRTFCLSLGCLLAGGLWVNAASEASFEVRAVVDAATSTTETVTLRNAKSEETLNVDRAVLLDTSSVAEAAFEKDERGYVSVMMRFTPAGAKRLEEVSTKYAGRRLAIFLGGHLEMAPSVHGPLSGGVLAISGGALTETEAKEMVRKINAALHVPGA
ncbi:MAG TPA: hypothetical protein VK961_27310 [Chthoniobacter sp.]|nr:hypothetical protein [Chthoniobacter sp.]